jgi:hypothetical protein
VAIQKARAFDAGAAIRRIQNIDLRTGGIQKTIGQRDGSYSKKEPNGQGGG